MANLGRSYEQASTCAAALKSQIEANSKINLPLIKTALVLGSGFAEMVDQGEPLIKIPYSTLPHLQAPKVTGHGGTFSVNRINGEFILLLNGRFHVYEGYEAIQSCFLIMVLHALGIKNVLLSNAAGGLNANYKVGDLMVIQDHINLLGLCGLHPLIGLDKETQAMGSRFLPSAHLYDRKLRALFLQAAQHTPDLQLQRGIYLCVSGPSYETPAEARFLHNSGADACGMSTTNECVMANFLGLKVLGFSAITNKILLDAEDDQGVETNHHEVLSEGKKLIPRLQILLGHFLASLNQET